MQKNKTNKVNKTKDYVKMVAVLGIMSALAAVCAGTFPMGLTFRVGQYLKLSPVFLIVALVGNLYGWWGAAIVAFVGDFLQSMLSGLGFSPLISAVNVLCGLCFGLLLYNSKSIGRIVLSILLTQIVGSLCLTTLALRIQYGMPIFPTVYWRMLQVAIHIVIGILLLWLVLIVLDVPSKIKKISNK